MNQLFKALAQPKWRIARWVLAAIAAIAAHAVVIAIFLWRPYASLQIAPAAAPQIFQVSMVAAPKTTMSQEQVEPQQAVVPQVQQRQPKAVVKPTVETVKPVSDIASDFVIKKVDKTEQKTELEPPEVPADKPKPIVIEPKEPEKEQKQAVEETAPAQQAQASSTPSLSQAKEAPQASAPRVGALSEMDAQAVISWQNNLAAHLERRKRYPRAAQIRGQQGVPWVSFTMDRQGKVQDVKLHRPSGVEVLDREVIALVKRAQPLPIPPENTPDRALSVTVPVAFFIQ